MHEVNAVQLNSTLLRLSPGAFLRLDPHPHPTPTPMPGTMAEKALLTGGKTDRRATGTCNIHANTFVMVY